MDGEKLFVAGGGRGTIVGGEEMNRTVGFRGRAPAVGDKWEVPRTPAVGGRCWRRALRRSLGRGVGSRGRGGGCVGARGRGAGVDGRVGGAVGGRWLRRLEVGGRGGVGGHTGVGRVTTHRATSETAEDSVLPERVV